MSFTFEIMNNRAVPVAVTHLRYLSSTFRNQSGICLDVAESACICFQGCSGAVHRVLSKMEGVTSFDIDLKSQKVIVKGTVDPQKVLDTVSKTGKATQFWQ